MISLLQQPLVALTERDSLPGSRTDKRAQGFFLANDPSLCLNGIFMFNEKCKGNHSTLD